MLLSLSIALLALLTPALLAFLAYRAGQRARRAAEASLGELRAARIQLSNVLELLMGAGFKRPKMRGWDDDWRAVPEPSAIKWR